MKRLRYALLLLVGCSGSTESTPANHDKDAGLDAASEATSDTASEATSDTASEATTDAADAAPLDPETCIYKSQWCKGANDCVVATHMVDCCGTLKVIGVNQASMDKFLVCEEQWRDSLPDCGCASQQTTDEAGGLVNDIADVTAECTNFTSEGGICRSHQVP